MKTFTWIHTDDWQGLYEDARLATQNHSIGIRQLADLAGDEPFRLLVVEADGALSDRVEDEGGFPGILPAMGEDGTNGGHGRKRRL
jgi:hypothetical protein